MVVISFMAHLELVLAILPLNGFRRHIIDSPNLLISMNIDGIVRYRLSDTKINDLQPAFDEYEVCRLEVGVDDVLLVDCHDRLKHLQRTGGSEVSRPITDHFHIPVANIVPQSSC